MRAFKTTVGCLFILGALSVTQTDAFARFEHHGHGGWTEGGRPENESKLHTVLRHPEERTFDAANDGVHEHGPEIVTPDGAHGIVHEDDVGVKHPESKAKSKAEADCSHNILGCQ
jgi:hypothetical protein